MHRGGIDRNFVRAGIQHATYVVDRPNSATHGQRYEHLACYLLDHPDHGIALIGGCRYIEKGELVRALLIVTTGNLHRVSGVAYVDELHPFDDPSGIHVQTRDNAFGETHLA